MDTFLEAKMKDLKTSIALYSVSSDVDGSRIVLEIGTRVNTAIVSVLATAREPLRKDPQLVASLIQGAMAGVSRRLLESACPEKQYQPLRQRTCAHDSGLHSRVFCQERKLMVPTANE